MIISSFEKREVGQRDTQKSRDVQKQIEELESAAYDKPVSESASTASLNVEAPSALIIEDNEDISFIFAQALKSAGFAVERILDGALAHQQLQTKTPDIIILDYHLPNMSGGMLLEFIRNQDRLRNVKVILATADGRASDFHELDVDMVLLKPITVDQIISFTRRLLGSG